MQSEESTGVWVVKGTALTGAVTGEMSGLTGGLLTNFRIVAKNSVGSGQASEII